MAKYLSGNCVKILEKKKAYLAMIFVQFAYAGMALFSRAAMSKGMNPFVFAAYRQAFGAITLLPFAFFLDRKKADPLSFRLLWRVFLLSLWITLGLNLYAYSINYVSATFASASSNNVPALTFVIAVLFRIESFSIRKIPGILKIAGLVLSLSGAMVYAFVKGPQVNFMWWSNSPMNKANNPSTHDFINNNKGKWIEGCLLMLLSNATFASWLVTQAPLVKQYPAKLHLTMMQCLFSSIQSTIWAIIKDRKVSSWRLQWDLNLFSMAYCGIVVTGMCYWLQMCAVEIKGPLFAATFNPLSLIITAIFSAIIWKEMLHLGSICGGILLVGGLYCVLWGKNKESEKEEENEDTTEAKEEANV